ncbi:hypothetical protein QWI17_02810 [Gilvimarinus sp. SDUM040013]|uniref:Transcriptional regulator n=1 Tax=Gilvimarinus gilvus TaxID=3058038 RepID=A0ABU4S3M6_9GAMM|nr:hypothetical protein [Gilvimarinus sp. SDUM040013]MDO3384764.1 hypothetical protein [Gilvimarinus sp. SDUM040013]MDX6850418.1 hypothetical protein [Gilvimarinus sp. SDUM040013]
MLKPQDTLLALKYWALQSSGLHLPVRDLAAALDMSASEVSKGARRLLVARLLVSREGGYYAEVNALTEWLSFGVRYAYAVQEKGYGRGMGTGWSCELVRTEMVPPSPGVIWAVPGGMQEGVIVEPIYKGVPVAASQDALLYKALALVDAIRLGRPRELAIARAGLKRLLTGRES